MASAVLMTPITAGSYLGTTANVMAELVKSHTGATQLPRKSFSIAKAAMIAGKTAALEKTLTEIPDLNTIGSLIQSGLKQLQSIGSPAAKQEHEVFNKQFTKLAKELKQHAQTLEELKKKCTGLTNETTEQLDQILKEVNSSKQPETKEKSQEILRQFVTLENGISHFEGNIKNLSLSQKATKAELENLHDLMKNSPHKINVTNAEDITTGVDERGRRSISTARGG